MLLALLAVFVLCEIATRLFVPASGFRVLADIYAPDADPRIGYTLKPNHTGEAFGAALTTNSLGFRGREWSQAKAPGTLRIALLGDSHGFGYGITIEQTFGELLAQRLQARLGRPVEVLNCSVIGYNTGQELAALEGKVLQLQPDLVMVLTCSNDADPALWADRDGFLRQGGKGDETHRDNVLADWRQRGLYRFQRQVFGHSRFLLWLRIQWYRWSMRRGAQEGEAGRNVDGSAGWMQPVGDGPVDEALRDPVYTPLAAMVERCRARGIPFALLSFNGQSNWRATLRALAAERSVPLLELVPLLEGADSWGALLRRWSLGWDSHLGPAAQSVWAEGIERFLLQHGLVH
jgi:hypothetical protein